MVASALMGPWIIGLGTTTSVATLIVLGIIGGVGFGTFDVAWDLNMQVHISERQLSRVYAFDQLGSFLAMPLGQIAAGPLAATISPSIALVGFGATALAVPLFVASLPAVRHLAAPTFQEQDP